MNKTSALIRKILVLLLLVSVPALVFLNLGQVFNYGAVQSEISEMEKAQRDWLELNKRMVANLAIYSSPVRLENIAGESLDLIKNNGEKSVHIILTPKKE